MSTPDLCTYVALLRGINVGGHAIVPMARLKACFEALGLSDVITYINSGNVIFRTRATDPRKLESRIEKALSDAFSLPIGTIVRSLREIDELLCHLPPSWHGDTPRKCNVIFLRHPIDRPDIVLGLKPKPGIEELHYYPGALLWSADTSNLGKSAMIKLSSNPTYKEMTVRILNTVRKVHALMQRVDDQSR